MTRIIFLSSILALSGLAAYSQTKTYVGFRGGTNISSAYIEHTVFTLNTDIGFETGFNAGILVKHFSFRKKRNLNTGVQLSINYSQKGWSQSFDTGEPTYSSRLNVLEVPIEAIISVGRKKLKYFVTAGFYGEYILGADQSPTPNLENLGRDEFYTYVDSRDNQVGYGLRGSAGLTRDFPFGTIHIEGAFSFSVSNFIKTEDRGDRLPDLSNLYVTGISIAYLIPFGKLDF